MAAIAGEVFFAFDHCLQPIQGRYQKPKLAHDALVQPILNAMVDVMKELQVRFTGLSNPKLDALDSRLIGTSATSI